MVISKKDINDNNFFQKLVKKIDQIEFYNDTNESFKILRGLNNSINANRNEMSNALIKMYDQLIARLRFILFVTQSDNEVYDLFKNYLAVGIKMAYVDLLEILKVRISLIVLPDRDNFKKQLIKVMLDNKEEISQKSIVIGKRKAKPTISAWLWDYNNYLGTGLKNNLEQGKYFANNKNFRALDKLEKLELKELFNIYEYLKRSSMTLDGNEDNIIIDDIDNKTYILQNDRFIEVPMSEMNRQLEIGSKKLGLPKTEAEKKIAKLKTEEEKYAKGGLEEQAIEEEIKEEKQIENLRIETNKYPVGSLERRAIEEEIKKLKKL